MLKNYFTVAWRNWRKNKLFSAINLIGLASGMAIALLIGLWISDELQFDHYYQNHDRLAQAAILTRDTGLYYTNLTIEMPLGNAFRMKYGRDFKRVALTSGRDIHVLAAGDKKVSAIGRWSQKDLPAMLTLDMLQGSRDALKDPSTLLISHTLAHAIFGRQDAVGRAVLIDNGFVLKVGGVYEDLPRNSSFYETDYLLPFDNQANYLNYKNFADNWYNSCGFLYVELDDHVSMEEAAASIRNVPTEHIKGYEERATLFPLDKLHLYNEFTNGRMSGGRIRTVWLFGIIGIFVLLLACINFMNLSTARSERRAKEVGIRKAIGSLRRQLVGQFISESLAMAFIAMGLALVLTQLALPFFNDLAAKQMVLPWNNSTSWVWLLAFTLLTGLIAGSYPAFYLSGFQPVKVLKGDLTRSRTRPGRWLGRSFIGAGRRAAVPRQVLMVVQFTVSIAMIIGTIIVFRQIQFAKDRPVGYTRAGLITVNMSTGDLYKHSEDIRAALLRTGAITDMGESGSLPTEVSSSNDGFYWKGVEPGNGANFGTIGVNYDYGHTIGWQVIDGRDFSRRFPADTASNMGGIIINEAAAKLMRLKHPVGEIVHYKGSIFSDADHVIVGVVKDMVMESPYEKPRPVIFFCGGGVYYMVIRIAPNMPLRQALAKIEPVFKEYNPGSPFAFRFTDDAYAQKFAEEERIGSLAGVFASLAILISCLGLFGLASFLAEQRVKEISVRKVLGATVLDLWQLLSKDFINLVLLACCIAIPLSWYFLHGWLQHYDYRINISGWIFAVVGAGALTITLLTVSWQAIRAALANPAKNLRTE